MEWWLILLIMFGSLVFLMVLGIPVAFCFLLVTFAGVLVLYGGITGLRQLALNIFATVTSFIMLPIPLFILMGEVMFRTGMGPKVITTLDNWVGRLPGRLALLAVASGTLFGTFTGHGMASTAVLGEVLVPEMEKRGYKKSMTIGPIIGSGGLAMMIPPSMLAVFIGVIGGVSIGRILIGIVFPGLLMAVIYAAYIIIRCRLQPSIAPPYEVGHIPLLTKLRASAQHILPLGLIVFLVVGVIFLGIATPSEAAATGAFGCFVLAAASKRLNWQVIKKSVTASLNLSVLIFMIIVGASSFGQILAFTGASRGLLEFVVGLPVSPIFIVIGMMVASLFMGMFMTPTAILMVTIPLFVPIVVTLGYDPVWLVVLMLLNMEMAASSPPFGMYLFVMKGVAPPDTTMGDIYRGALPFLGCDLISMALIIVFPAMVLWLPSIMR